MPKRVPYGSALRRWSSGALWLQSQAIGGRRCNTKPVVAGSHRDDLPVLTATTHCAASAALLTLLGGCFVQIAMSVTEPLLALVTSDRVGILRAHLPTASIAATIRMQVATDLALVHIGS